jgi:energy-coupling factor transporter ATP-binding protein EcfA2
MSENKRLIYPNQRLLLAGKTGSGKTWLAERLTGSLNRLIVLDGKATLGHWKLKEPGFIDWIQFLDRGQPGRFRVLPPITDHMADWYDEIFERLYDAGNLTLYIDEGYAVSMGSGHFSKWLNALYTRGRERGIGVWAATQRPAWIPLFMISEADWLFVFRLNLEEDRKRLAAVAGEQVRSRIRDPHGFWLVNAGEDRPVYYKSAVSAPSPKISG